MDNKEIKYICFYDTEKHEGESRLQSPAAHQKIDFISTLLFDLGYRVEIVSPSQTTTNKSFGSRKETISANRTLRLFKTIGRSGIVSKIKRKLFGYRDFKKYVKSSVKRGDIVIVYHSLEYLRFIIKLKKRKNIRLIVEFEELYSDINPHTKFTRKREMLLAKIADALILPTYTMNSLINIKGIPSIVLHGDYSSPNQPINKKINMEMVRVIYTGTFDPNKGGATNAIKAASLLPNNFELNVVGFGTKEQVESTMNLCKEQQIVSKCKINYVGKLPNSECERLIRESDIGLATQNSSGAYNSTSFPSKVLTYLKNGVKVVSSKNESVESSDIADLLFFYDNDDPSNIADAIITASHSEQSEKERLSRLKSLYNKAKTNLGFLLNKRG